MQKHNLTEIIENIKTIITDHTDVAEENTKTMTAESHFVNDLGIRSLDFISVIFQVEKDYHVDIAEKDYEKLATIGELAEYTAKQIELLNLTEFCQTVQE